MNRISTRKLTINGMLIALVFVATYFIRIQGLIPSGYLNLGDTIIIMAAVLYGRNSGMISGAIGAALADLALGFTMYAPITFIVKGLEGYITGLIAQRSNKSQSGSLIKLIAVIAGSLIMVAGYFIAEATVLRLADKTFGLVVAVNDLPFNLLQGGVCAALGYSLSVALLRLNVLKAVE